MYKCSKRCVQLQAHDYGTLYGFVPMGELN